ncbi:MAG: flagellar biosynthesis protein FlgA [Epsilonproteobacteria bacterium]|nr:MAG: flagellar biosynthesis protein FlgA [Campylobacterota bacterium]RLA67519.1 MAG: flagellar biosynthesis protein FlgA [Campylobacterota bacterium]
MKNLIALTIFIFSTGSFGATTKIKDLISLKGVRKNPIIGYGLIVGLNGTGDSASDITKSSLKSLYLKLGLEPQKNVTSKNVAAVVVTADLPPFARVGQKIDITVSSVGDSKSLAGGTLLITPLKGGDGIIYSIASGKVSIGGLKQGKNFATTGRVPGGGIIEKELAVKFSLKDKLELRLINPDFTTAARMEKTINQNLGGQFARAKDSATIELIVPVSYNRKVVQLMAIVENYKVNVDIPANVVINERTGTIVSGGNVTLYPVAISHGNLSIEIEGSKADGNKSEKVIYVNKSTSLKDLAQALNAFGAGPEDLISIIQALKKNGSLIGNVELI